MVFCRWLCAFFPGIALTAGNYAIYAKNGIEIPSTHEVTTPTGGKIAQVTEGSDTFYTVTEADGTTVAKHAIIEPMEALTYTVTLIAYDKTNATEKAGGEVAFSDSGKGTTISGDYQENSSRTVGVYPASDYTFTGWAKGSPSGEIVSTASPYTFTVTEDVTLYALFEKVTTYPVWVGETQVTSENKDDILTTAARPSTIPTARHLRWITQRSAGLTAMRRFMQRLISQSKGVPH